MDCVIVRDPKKREARKPKDRGNHEHIGAAQHKMTLSGLPAIQLSLNGVICLGQVHQEYTAPI